ncbi:hypothetical protein ACR9WD_05830 [Glutamicibacter sp. PAEs-4]|uniref:hypothetical protein n=1 Tax=Glutamicibacter sp. PAEs-4 TaxID=3444114 RepID=UPI003EBCE15A
MNEIHPLGELIQEVMDRNEWSLRGLSSRADQLGFKMSHSNFGRLKDEPITSMKGETIKMLAKVLKVPEARVATAILDSMGVANDGSQERVALTDFVRTSSEVSARDQRILLSVIGAMRDDESGSNGQPERDNPDSTGPHLRTVASEGNARPGQKTAPGYGITELHGEEARSIPVPPRERLAAHPKVKTKREQLDEETGEREPNALGGDD